MAAVEDGFVARPVAKVRQTQVFYDRLSYSAFPHVVRLEGDELLLAFRQAPRNKEGVRHTHPRSVITVVRSLDRGQRWQTEDAAQLGAGGGQECGLIYLGKGRVGAAVAAHEVAPESEVERAGFAQRHVREYPFRSVGALWCWSDNWGLTWRLDHAVLVGPGMQACAPPVQLTDGTLLIPAYGTIGRASRCSAVLYRSVDGGQSWGEMEMMAQGRPQTRHYQEPVVLEVAPGHVLGMLRVGEERRDMQGFFWQCISADSGRTWSLPRRTAIRSGACPRLLKLRDGRLVLTYGRRYGPFGLYASISEDGGRSWGGNQWLLRETVDGDQGYTSSVELDDGRIFTASYAKNGRGVTGITGTYWEVP